MAAIMRTGGSVRNSILDVLGTVVPGIRGVTRGGVSIRGHLNDWGTEVLDSGLFNRSVNDLMKTDAGQEKIKSILKQIRNGKITYIGLMGAVYKLNGGATFVNTAKDSRITPLMQFAALASLFEVARATAELGTQLGAVSKIDQFQANQRLGAAAEQLLNVPGLGKKVAEAL